MADVILTTAGQCYNIVNILVIEGCIIAIHCTARPVFTVQINKSNEVKASCIQRFMPALYADEEQFWIEFMEQVNILLDSRRFCRECKALGYKAENVAEHVVFLGSAPMRKVLREGVQNSLGASIQFYKERFSPTTADAYRETEEQNSETAA